jgi:plastocyanin
MEPRMTRCLVGLMTTGVAGLMMTAGPHVAVPRAQAGTGGSITGHVRLTGPAPANSIMRMGADPLCSKANAGKRLTQDLVLRGADGGLANAFVDLQGTFPSSQVPAAPVAPVTIEQRGCIFVPRVVGVRVGQALRVTNGDPMAHNVHSLSTRGNEFNVSQPKAGMTSTFQLKNADVVMRIKCDMHGWMVSYVGVVPHPYFAVSGSDGSFRITGVPPGRHTIRVWHERYGRLTATVQVKAGATATANFSYTGTEQPSTAGVFDLVIPGHPRTATLVARGYNGA